MNINITHGSTTYVNLDSINGLENEGFNVFTKGIDEDDNDNCSTKGQKSLAVSNKSLAFNNKICQL